MGLLGGLFGKKKRELPPLELPKYDSGSQLKELPPLPDAPAPSSDFGDLPPLEDLPPMPGMNEEEPFVFAPEEEAKPEFAPAKEEEVHGFKTYDEEEKLLPAPKEYKIEPQPTTTPKFVDVGELFVRSDDYSEIMKNIKEIRAKVNESDKTYLNIKELKTHSDKELGKMKDIIEDINKKLSYVDKTVFGG